MQEPRLLKESKRLYIPCSPELKLKIMQAAAKEHTSMAKWINQAILDKLGLEVGLKEKSQTT